ncbi:hypothetical protein ABTJ50_21700, partial [Acinetobacter baumannii]
MKTSYVYTAWCRWFGPDDSYKKEHSLTLYTEQRQTPEEALAWAKERAFDKGYHCVVRVTEETRTTVILNEEK